MLLSWGKKKVQPGLGKRSHEGKSSKTNSQRKLIVLFGQFYLLLKGQKQECTVGGGGAAVRHTKPSQQEGWASATNPGLKKSAVQYQVFQAGCLMVGKEVRT